MSESGICDAICDVTEDELQEIEDLVAELTRQLRVAIAVRDALNGRTVLLPAMMQDITQLGWKSIPTVVAESVDSLLKMAQAESDENTCRKDFTPEEAVRMGQRIEGAISKIKRAAQRDGGKKAGRGRPKQDQIGSGKLPEPNRGGPRLRMFLEASRQRRVLRRGGRWAHSAAL